MKSFVAAVALAAAVVPAAVAQNPLTINTLEGIVQCEPAKIMWSGGTPPYYMSFLPAQQPSAPPMKVFPVQQGTSYTWIVDLPVGTAFTTEIKDSTGQPNYSAEQIVNNGTDASCLNASVTETNTSGNGPATAAPSGSASVSPAAAAVTGSSSSGASATSSHTSSSATASQTSPAPTHTNAATRSSAIGAAGIAGFIGLVAALL